MNTGETEKSEADAHAVMADWAAEAERRLDGILAGERKTVSGEEVARRVRERIAR